ncbi:MAG: hypothetical protein PHY42_02740 [Bacilli bacterium]|nr:hypothetical protein [Bacilli bacterium]
MKFPKDVMLILDTLTEAGYQAYVVGGAIRDLLRGVHPSDYDITTNAIPSIVMDLFKIYKVFPIGLQHGTLLLRVNHHNYEITTFREEGHYLDYRHPITVEFIGNIHSDLSRRDFTINAMAYHHELIDDHGGQKDIKAKIIRAVGDPNLRFQEDALRILRALRFSSQLHYTIEPQTKAAILENYPLLKNISQERIQIEWFKMVTSDLTWILEDYKEVIRFLFPGLTLEGIMRYREVYPHLPKELVVHLACLFLDNPRYVDDILSMKAPKKLTEQLMSIITHYHEITSLNVEYLINIFNILKSEDVRIILLLKEVLGELPGASVAYLDITSGPYQLSNLAMNGHDLKHLGVRPNQTMKKILLDCLVAVVKKEVKNEKDELLLWVKNTLLS